MNIILGIIIFIFGLCLGSFLNCLIYRLALPNFSLKNLGGLKERSYCPHCKHTLSWQDLIPILSFIFLRGKCRYCGKNISFQYPLVELATGILFVSCFMFHVSWWVLIYYFAIVCFLIIVFVYDLKHYIILDKIIYPAIIIALAFNVLTKSFFNPLLAGLGAGAFFFLIWLVSQGKWMGLGDVKLGFFIGLFLGFPNILVSLFFSFFIGAIIGLGLIIFAKKSLKSEVPFGPFLVTGTFIAIFWGKEIINWYLNLL